MREMGIDSTGYSADGKTFSVINRNNVVTYLEEGGGNKIKIEDLNGDMIADKIDIDGYIEGLIEIHKSEPKKELERANLKRIEVSHTFSTDASAAAGTSVSSSMNLTLEEESAAFINTQTKFINGIAGVYNNLENQSATASLK
jgi:hypothetical protein